MMIVILAVSCTLMTTPESCQGQGWCVNTCTRLENHGLSGNLAPAQSMDLPQHSHCARGHELYVLQVTGIDGRGSGSWV